MIRLSTVRSRWVWILGVIALIMMTLNVVAFYPGYFSYDSLSQLAQAQGLERVGDWHPPVMMLVWKILIGITGTVGSMLVFQLGLLWSSLFILAWVVYFKTKRIGWSLVPFVLGVLPFTLNLSGIIWKDVQMAYSLLFALTLLIAVHVARNNLKPWMRISAISIAGIAVLYAALLRYNAVLAIAPIIYLFVYEIAPKMKLKFKIGIVLAFILMVFGTGAIVSAATGAIKENALSSVMVDDIVNTRSQNEIEGSGSLLRSMLVNVQFNCTNSGYIMNAYWICANDTQRYAFRGEHYAELREYWIKSILRHPLRYVSYKLETFAVFLFATDRPVYHPGIDANEYGHEVLSKKMQYTKAVYTQEFGYGHFMLLFQPWFWLIIGALTLWYGISRTGKMRVLIVAVALSSLLYIIGYIPVVVATDYRYIYWAVWSLLFIWLLIFVEKYVRRDSIKTTTKKLHKNK